MSDPDRRVYVVSTGRAGTTYLSNVLGAAIPGGLEHQRAGSRALNIAGHLAAQTGLASIARAALRAGRGTERPASTADPLVSVALALTRGSVRDPRDVFVHVVRDPRDVVRSFMNWKRASVKRTVLHHAVPLWQPSPVLELGPAALRMTKPERFAWVWDQKNRWFQEWLRDHPGYVRHRSEDLFGTDGSERLRQLSAAIGADLRPVAVSRPANASSGGFPPWAEWTPDLARAVDRRAGALMQTYGYGQEPEWKRLLRTT